MRIDSHQHFWKYDPTKQGWIDSTMGAIKQDFLPENLFPELVAHDLDGSVVVQAEESFRETAWLLDLCSEEEKIKGVIGWADLSSDDLDRDLDQFAASEKLKGYREVLQAKSPSYFLKPEFIRGLTKIGKRGYSYDLLVFSSQLEEATELIKRSPEQPIVIDHLAKPNIKLGTWRDWKKSMSLLSEREYIFCKLSGMITEADWKSWKADDLRPYLEICLELFGPNRLMFGSDWPVCLLAGTYSEVVKIIEDFVSPLSPDEKELIWGKTACNFYNIKPNTP